MPGHWDAPEGPLPRARTARATLTIAELAALHSPAPAKPRQPRTPTLPSSPPIELATAPTVPSSGCSAASVARLQCNSHSPKLSFSQERSGERSPSSVVAQLATSTPASSLDASWAHLEPQTPWSSGDGGSAAQEAAPQVLYPRLRSSPGPEGALQQGQQAQHAQQQGQQAQQAQQQGQQLRPQLAAEAGAGAAGGVLPQEHIYSLDLQPGKLYPSPFASTKFASGGWPIYLIPQVVPPPAGARVSDSGLLGLGGGPAALAIPDRGLRLTAPPKAAACSSGKGLASFFRRRSKKAMSGGS